MAASEQKQKFFTLEEAAEFCISQCPTFFADKSKAKASEIGNGNLNYVWKVSDGEKSLIVKQAPPFIRCVGESWPLTIDRARIEAEALLEMGKACPEHTVKLYGYDAEIGAMVMEDLCHMEVLRDAQNKMSADDWIKKFSKVSEQLAVWVAEVAFATSDFSMDCAEKHKMVSKFSNPELCTTSNAVFFVQPWTTHEMNNHEDYLKPTIKKMQDDVELKTAVARLQMKFNCSSQSLIHGDLHTGSIFVSEDACKVFDTEFAYFGPIAFDLGQYIAHTLLNCASKSTNDVLGMYCDQVMKFLDTFKASFLKKAQESKTLKDKVMLEYAETFLDETIKDSFGFAATDMFRRTVGISHVEDVDKLENEDAKKLARELSLDWAGKLLKLSEVPKTGEALQEMLKA